MPPLQTTASKLKEIALIGNPNAGKTTLFNALTGLRQLTANYPGVTVEKKIGFLRQPGKETLMVIDLPGAYSLLPRSLDEEIVHDVLFGFQKGTPAPELAVVILDAGNMERNLYLASQVIETGIPVILAVNMWDLAQDNGIHIDLKKLESITGCPCIKTVGNRGIGVEELRQAIFKQLDGQNTATKENTMPRLTLPFSIGEELKPIEALLAARLPDRVKAVQGEALRLLGDHNFRSPFFEDKHIVGELKKQIGEVRARLEKQAIDWTSLETESRYAMIEDWCSQMMTKGDQLSVSVSERLDKILTHQVWGLLFFFGIMGVVFQSIFSWVSLPMDLIAVGIEFLGRTVSSLLPDGALQSLIVDGMIAGVGNVVIFLPQIFLLFFFIALFEDTGYMARAAFVLDRVMKKVGLNGKAFLPLLSSFACAVPGIMSARTIEDRNDRLATILVAPLMSCSARLPVYTLMIGAFIPSGHLLGIFNLKGVTLFAMYLLSIIAGLGMAAIFRRTLLKGTRTPFIFELPPYRIPNFKTVFLTMWDRGKEFLYRAGSIIFCLSIILWFLTSYPKHPDLQKQYEIKRQQAEAVLQGEPLEQRLAEINDLESGEALRHSFAGQMGHWIEPVIKPLGFDWKLGIGLVGSFAAREVLVSTLAIAYNVGSKNSEDSVDLIRTLQSEVSPETGKPLYTPLVAVSLMVFFVLACQCMSTVAIVKRETNSWRWPLFMIFYMTLLAWTGSFVVFQGGKLLGWG